MFIRAASKRTGFIAGIVGIIGLAGCGGALDTQDQQRGTAKQVPAVLSSTVAQPVDSVLVDAPPREEAIIREVLSAVGAQSLRSVRLGDPPSADFQPSDGLPGDRWLYVELAVADAEPTTSQAMARWEAAMVAGEVRTRVAAADLPVPFGYSMNAVLPDGTSVDESEISILIGAPIDIEARPVGDSGIEAARLREAASSVSLRVVDLEFRGTERASVTKLASDGTGQELLKRWQDVMAALFAERSEYSYYVEATDAEGRLVVAVGNSPTTWGATSWIRPDLHEFWNELTRGSPTGDSEE